MITPRKEVKWFAAEMEAKLRENDRKGGWLGCRWYQLFPRIMDERDELLAAIKPRELHSMNHNMTREQQKHIISECADIANFAMMIADIVRNEPTNRRVNYDPTPQQNPGCHQRGGIRRQPAQAGQ